MGHDKKWETRTRVCVLTCISHANINPSHCGDILLVSHDVIFFYFRLRRVWFRVSQKITVSATSSEVMKTQHDISEVGFDRCVTYTLGLQLMKVFITV